MVVRGWASQNVLEQLAGVDGAAAKSRFHVVFHAVEDRVVVGGDYGFERDA